MTLASLRMAAVFKFRSGKVTVHTIPNHTSGIFRCAGLGHELSSHLLLNETEHLHCPLFTWKEILFTLHHQSKQLQHNNTHVLNLHKHRGNLVAKLLLSGRELWEMWFVSHAVAYTLGLPRRLGGSAPWRGVAS